MAEKKAPPNRNIKDFLDQIEDEQKRADSYQLLEIMQRLSGEAPRMWGSNMIGFGSYHYKYESGREGDYFMAGFSPRKRQLSIYIMAGLDRYNYLLEQLGKHKTGKSCLYIKRLADVDQGVLESLITASLAHMREQYPTN